MGARRRKTGVVQDQVARCLHDSEIGYLANDDGEECEDGLCTDPAEYNCKACGLEFCELHAEEPFGLIEDEGIGLL